MDATLDIYWLLALLLAVMEKQDLNSNRKK